MVEELRGSVKSALSAVEVHVTSTEFLRPCRNFRMMNGADPAEPRILVIKGQSASKLSD